MSIQRSISPQAEQLHLSSLSAASSQRAADPMPKPRANPAMWQISVSCVPKVEAENRVAQRTIGIVMAETHLGNASLLWEGIREQASRIHHLEILATPFDSIEALDSYLQTHRLDGVLLVGDSVPLRVPLPQAVSLVIGGISKGPR